MDSDTNSYYSGGDYESDFSAPIDYENFELKGDIGDTMVAPHNDLYVINDQRQVVLLPNSIIDTDISTFYSDPLEKWFNQPGTFSVNLHVLHRNFIERFTQFDYSHHFSLYFGYDSNNRVVILRRKNPQYQNFEEYVIYEEPKTTDMHFEYF